jgi:hypothetical protein
MASPFVNTFKNINLSQSCVYETETRTTSGAASLNVPVTMCDGTAGALAISLAAGKIGQIKTFICIQASNASTITPNVLLGGTTIALGTAGESVTLLYTGSGWAIIGSSTSESAAITNGVLVPRIA